MRNGGRSWTAVIAVAWALGVTACGEDAETETACCELLMVCSECACNDTTLTIGASGDGKACRVYLDKNELCNGGFAYSESQASSDCGE